MKVEFLKKGFYRGKLYEKGSIAEISRLDVKAFMDCKVVKMYIPVRQNPLKPLEELSYRELQKKCKAKKIPAVGTKEDLIISLTDKEVI